MEIVQPSPNGESPIAAHVAGEFHWRDDHDLRAALPGARTLARTGRVSVELGGDGLRSLVARDAELSEIFMRAFILRRLQLISAEARAMWS